MKRIPLILGFLMACPLSADEELQLKQNYSATQHAPAQVKATVRLPASVMIGEEIPAALVIENTGTTAFQIGTGGDYAGTGYPLRIEVKVTDAAGQVLPERPAEVFGNGGGFGGNSTLEPGKSESIEFPLECYVGFKKAGTYSVTVGHDLGWIVDKEHPHPLAHTTLTVTEPTETQAAALVGKIFARQPTDTPKDSSDMLEREWDLEKSLCVLRHPAYLSSLLVRAKGGSKAAVMGIGHIANTDATAMLISLFDHSSPEIVRASAEQILRRLPSREEPWQRPVPYYFSRLYQIIPLLPSAWDAKFEKPLMDATVKLWAYPDPDVIEVAGYLMQCRGGAEHAPAILAALQKSLDVYQAPRSGLHANTLDPPKPQRALIEALDVLRNHGWRTGTAGGTALMVAHFRELADNNIPKPSDDSWKFSMLTWIENGPPLLKTSALEAIPQPMPNEFEKPLLNVLNDPDWGVLRVACEVAGASKRPVFIRPLVQIVETVHETFVQNAASNSAIACGATLELWHAWASVITDQERMYDAISALIHGTIDSPPSEGGSGNSGFTRDQRFTMRVAWLDFLHEHQEQLILGKRVTLLDPEIIAALTGLNFQPDQPAVKIHFKNGSDWPPRPKK